MPPPAPVLPVLEPLPHRLKEPNRNFAYVEGEKGNVASALLLSSDLASVSSEHLFTCKIEDKGDWKSVVSFIFPASPSFLSAALSRQGGRGGSEEN